MVSSNRNKSKRQHESVSRFHVPVNVERKTTSTPVPHPPNDFDADIEFEPSNNHGNILFVYLDDHSSDKSNIVASLRTINHDVQTFSDSSSCREFLRTSIDQIFLILASIDRQVLEEFHQIQSVEAIFLLNDDGQIDSRFPKLYGVYVHVKELLTSLKDTLQWFEQTQMEVFVFEHDRIFLWSQLWKEEVK